MNIYRTIYEHLDANNCFCESVVPTYTTRKDIIFDPYDKQELTETDLYVLYSKTWSILTFKIIKQLSYKWQSVFYFSCWDKPEIYF